METDNKKNEQQTNNLVGNIYGSRVSKNGKWLNLIIAFKMKGEELKITCPIRNNDDNEDKPFAIVKEIEEGVVRASICGVKVYQDRKEPPKQEEALSDDLPF